MAIDKCSDCHHNSLADESFVAKVRDWYHGGDLHYRNRCIGYSLTDSHNDAVVVVPSVDAHSGPGNDYLTEFKLHAGAEINVLEERKNWVRISLPGDLQGWLPSEAVEKLS